MQKWFRILKEYQRVLCSVSPPHVYSIMGDNKRKEKIKLKISNDKLP